MRRFSSTDLRRRQAEVFDAAVEEPVIITARGKPTYALISVQEFNRLLKSEAGQAFAANELSDEDMDIIVDAAPDDDGED